MRALQPSSPVLLGRPPWRRLGTLVPRWLLAALFVLGIGCLVGLAVTRPIFIADSSHWIRRDESFQFVGRAASDEVVLFRRQFDTPREGDSLDLTVESLGIHTVLLDDQIVVQEQPTDARGRSMSRPMVEGIRSGTHILLIGVQARSTHPCLRVVSRSIALDTDEKWEASRDGISWGAVCSLDQPLRLPENAWKGWVSGALGESWPLYAILLATGVAFALRCRSPDERAVRMVRNALVVGLSALCLNNFFMLPTGASIGMDVDAHVAYVKDVLATWRVPLANEGWERLQPPLYYFSSAVIAIPAGWIGLHDLERTTRLIPLACCVAQVFVSWRCVRLAFPADYGAQIVALVAASCLPMSVYVSQVAGNEPLAALAAAVTVLLLLRIVTLEEVAGSKLAYVVLGCVIGLGCLTKLTTVGLVPLATLVVARTAWNGRGPRWALTAVSLTLVSLMLVAGWYYARNWIELGRPFINGSNFLEMNQEWWQDPGHRTLHDFTRFGASLSQPVHASAHGLWDALYSTTWVDGAMSGRSIPPPWNMSTALVGAWIGIPLTIALIIGAGIVAVRRKSPAHQVALLALSALLAPIVVLFAQFPVYSAAKATYALGAAPAIGILVATGMTPLLARPWGRVAASAIMLGLMGASILGYWVVRGS